MLTFYIYVYIFLCALLLMYGLIKRKNALNSFLYSLALNIFPWVAIPKVSMDIARIAGIPLVYLPMIAVIIPITLYSKGKISKTVANIFLFSMIYICYISLTTFRNGFSLITFSYYFGWIVNIITFFSSVSFFQKVELDLVNSLFKKIIFVLLVGCLIGIIRVIFNISDDANFMPFMNRNGTVVLIVMLAPSLYHLWRWKEINLFILFIGWFVILFTLILIESRSGLLGFLFGTFLYFYRIKNLKSQLITISLLSVIFLYLLLPISTGIYERIIIRTPHTITKLITGEGLSPNEEDYRRYMLLQSSIELIKNNFWIGTGIGLENYRVGLRNIGIYEFSSKAHNFYLSYLAELGIIGFSILLCMLFQIYRKLAPLNTPYRAFRISFLSIAFMMTMNEYILMPELWFFYGMLIGVSIRQRVEENKE